MKCDLMKCWTIPLLTAIFTIKIYEEYRNKYANDDHSRLLFLTVKEVTLEARYSFSLEWNNNQWSGGTLHELQ